MGDADIDGGTSSTADEVIVESKDAVQDIETSAEILKQQKIAELQHNVVTVFTNYAFSTTLSRYTTSEATFTVKKPTWYT